MSRLSRPSHTSSSPGSHGPFRPKSKPSDRSAQQCAEHARHSQRGMRHRHGTYTTQPIYISAEHLNPLGTSRPPCLQTPASAGLACRVLQILHSASLQKLRRSLRCLARSGIPPSQVGTHLRIPESRPGHKSTLLSDRTRAHKTAVNAELWAKRNIREPGMAAIGPVRGAAVRQS